MQQQAVGRSGVGFSRKLFEDAVQTFLLRSGDGQEFNADSREARPSDGRIADREGCLPGWLKLQLQLHAGEGPDHAFNTASFDRQIFQRCFVP